MPPKMSIPRLEQDQVRRDGGRYCCEAETAMPEQESTPSLRAAQLNKIKLQMAETSASASASAQRQATEPADKDDADVPSSVASHSPIPFEASVREENHVSSPQVLAWLLETDSPRHLLRTDGNPNNKNDAMDCLASINSFVKRVDLLGNVGQATSQTENTAGDGAFEAQFSSSAQQTEDLEDGTDLNAIGVWADEAL